MIAQEIEKYTAENSNYQTSRNYISLSSISLSVGELISQYKTGFPDSIETRLKCYKGYQMEKDLLARIQNIFGDRVNINIELSFLDGLVKGHPDFSFDGYPADCKSVLMDEWLPQDGKVSRKIYWQMQGYMKIMAKDKALLIYESRESGKLVEVWIKANANIQKEIGDKLVQIKNSIQ